MLLCASLLALAPFAWKQQVAFSRYREEPPARQASADQPSLLIRGNPRLKQVALTFDDGPHPYATLKLLSVLRTHDVRATFFVVGDKAKIHPDLIRMEIDMGHAVGNHTMHHANLLKLPPDQTEEEIAECGQVIRDITGQAPRYFRPPGGQYNEDLLKSTAERGYTTVLWTDVARDYQMPGDGTIEEQVLAHIGNGGIILLHDGIYQTIDALPRIITRLRREGYQFVTLDEMLRAKAAASETAGHSAR
ncbi:MAG: polysaccharide deacetylase family protein [Armatimonadota bacterium]